MRDNYLFSGNMIHDVISSQSEKLRKEIDAIEAKRLLGTSPEEWCAYFESGFRLNTPKLVEEQIQASQDEVDVDVSGDPRRFFTEPGRPFFIKGTRFKFFVPFEGDPQMFKCRPSAFTLNPPSADIVKNELVFSYTRMETGATDVRKAFDSELDEVRSSLVTMEKDVANYNSSIRGNALSRINERREKLLASQKAVESLGFPLRRREGAPKTYAAPEVKRKAPVAPVARPAGSPPEPALEMKEYDNILSIINSMTTVMERSPHAFKEMGEEDLRQHYLVQLNGQYEGQATGETFNYEGKTDILIRSGSKNVFIAECKFWKGADSFTKALNQLLGYAAWRDSKLALIIFNKNKGFSAVLKQIPDLLAKHPNFVRTERYGSESGFRAVLHHNEDKQRELLVTVLAFDIPG